LVKEQLSKVFDGSAEVKIFGNDNQLKSQRSIRYKTMVLRLMKVNKILFQALKSYYSADLTDKFVNSYDGKKFGIVQASKVGPTVAEDIKTNAWAVLGAMLIVFLYLLISFRKWQYGLGAIAAVAHDVIFVLGIYSLFTNLCHLVWKSISILLLRS
jgi:SecD/SecF fusion protein